MTFLVTKAFASVLRGKLSVELALDDGSSARLLPSQVDAILPVDILLGTRRTVPPENGETFLSTLNSIIARMAEGRKVTVWQGGHGKVAGFESWRFVRFLEEEEEEEEC